MSTTLYFLSLAGELESIYLAVQKADADYWRMVGVEDLAEVPREELRAVDMAFQESIEAWHSARIALGRDAQLPILESSHRDPGTCELIDLFGAADPDFIITVSDSNIQEIADAWEDSNGKRTFPMGRGKGTVISWLLDHRGEKITLSS